MMFRGKRTILACALVLAACGGGEDSTTSTTSEPATTPVVTDAPASSPVPTPVVTDIPAADPATYHTGGRVELDKDGASQLYSWPGIYFEANFSGTGIGMLLNDESNYFDVIIDGQKHTQINPPSSGIFWVHGLSDGAHTIKLTKRSESLSSNGRFGGFFAVDGGQILAAPAARQRQVEFIGDSFVVGYGNELISLTARECSDEEVNSTTNANKSYGAMIAQQYNADYQINAIGGLGLVHNWPGVSELNYPAYYDRALLSVAGDIWQKPDSWNPQLVVIKLGTNDFGSAPGPDEPYTAATLPAAFKAAYHDLIAKLRTRYGPTTNIVVIGGNSGWGERDFNLYTATKAVVDKENAEGDSRVYFLENPGSGDGSTLGCNWHPNLSATENFTDELKTYLDGLPDIWNGRL
ncbi:MAG TPA: GDSL-type esterase/lipase family protein [Chitinolyticbacter sp.]|nr:GDSL-type esterase/lipase family protein [Chitinolyticbacter sp.]